MSAVDAEMHYHYVCPECGHETCPVGKPTAGMWLTAADTHAGEKHADMWGPEPDLEHRPECSRIASKSGGADGE